MKFEEAMSPTLYNVHFYMPTKKETLMQKNMKKKKKKKVNEELVVSGSPVSQNDTQGIPVRVPSIEYSSKDDRIVRRKFPKPVTLSKSKKRRKK